jgi:hypothetical protein
MEMEELLQISNLIDLGWAWNISNKSLDDDELLIPGPLFEKHFPFKNKQ